MAPTDPGGLALDLDGTLIDARLRQVGVAAEALEELGAGPLPEAAFWRAKRAGANTRVALERVGVAPELAVRVAALWGERIESDAWLDRDRALAGIPRLLRELSSGRRLIVITARRRPEGAERSLRAAGLRELVSELVVVDPGEAVAAKTLALRRARAALFAGDTDTDGAAAGRAGVPFAAVATGQRAPSFLRAQGYEPQRSLRAALASVGEVGPDAREGPRFGADAAAGS